MTVHGPTFHGFANPVDPSPAELRAWAYQPDSVPLSTMPQDWDLLVSGNHLATTLFELAMDPACPARRFALHCLYIYAGDGIRTGFRAHPRRRLRKLVEQAELSGDHLVRTWAYNTRTLMDRPELFDYHDWCEGGLVRENRRIG
ncbi:hypothetical protein O7606_18440 [Micromonospora sp. WMMD882]|uniref:hypothetical protein n=1 Tax=Micromonospora sp. WMMD882 TaxID=3015151 RepID=UPI00248BA1A3|nr:hypothetical protein [Micromonospora sp. WMMD882]WBB78207.1 hypothetical protein O7606_18440 [Micromonospora sp. WMMD882]